MHSRHNDNVENSCSSGCRVGSLPDANVVLVTDKTCTLWPPVPSMEYLPALAGCYLVFWQRMADTGYFSIVFWRLWLTPSAICSGLWLSQREEWHSDWITEQHQGAGLPKPLSSSETEPKVTHIWQTQRLVCSPLWMGIHADRAVSPVLLLVPHWLFEQWNGSKWLVSHCSLLQPSALALLAAA